VPILIVGRAVQAISGSVTWIIGLATLTDTVGHDKAGRTLGTVSSFFTSGLLLGPMASGMLLPLVGYWNTWMVAIIVLGVDIIMRVVMIENKQSREATDVNKPDEQTSLLHASSSRDDHQNYNKPQSYVAIASPKPNSVPEITLSSDNFYKFILTNPRTLTALACHCGMAVILVSLDTTLPLHTSRTFGWDTTRVSSMFLLLQMPSLILGTPLGMLKDRVGTRIPTGFGFLVMALCIWLLGAAANDRLAFGRTGHERQIITMVSLVGIGTARAFSSGSGILEITSKSLIQQPYCSIF
jgi:MFS family permease